MTTYLKFQLQAPLSGRKLPTWRVSSAVNGEHLGTVKWRGGWRRYVFEPRDDCTTAYDAGCLKELASFLQFQTGEFYLALKESKR